MAKGIYHPDENAEQNRDTININASSSEEMSSPATQSQEFLPEQSIDLSPTLTISPTPTPDVLSAVTLDPCPDGSQNTTCQVAELGVGSVIGTLLQFIFVIAVILALGFLVFGGIRWLTSGGNKENVDTARGTIISAIVGLIIVFLSYFILNIVLLFLTGAGLTEIEIPSLTSPSNS